MSVDGLDTSWELQEKTAKYSEPLEKEPVLFPFNSLPMAIQEYCHELSRVTQAPVEFSSLVCLGVISGCISKGAIIPNCFRGDSGKPTLQIAAALESGTGKTTVFKLVTKPLNEWCRDETARHKKEILAPLLCRIARLQGEIGQKQKDALRCDAPERRELLIRETENLQRELREAEEKAVLPTYLAEDATLEALVQLLANNGRVGQEAVFSYSDDARQALRVLLGKYSKTGNIDDNLLVKGFSWSPHQQHRRTDGGSAMLSAPCVPLLWLIQPDLLTEMIGTTALTESGFLQRFILEEIEWPVERYQDPGEFCPVQRAAWEGLVYELLGHYRMLERPEEIQTSPEAKELLLEYRNSLVPLVNDPNELQDIRSFAQRWAEWAWRFALNFHIIEHRTQAPRLPISVETAANAISLAKYYGHRKVVILTGSRIDRKNAIKAKILDKARSQSSLKARDLILCRIVKNTAEARLHLDELCAENILIKREVKTPGGGPISTQYHLVNRPFATLQQT